MPLTPLPPPPYAGETEDTIRDRMLDAVDDSFIKTEGDVIYDMLQPAAMELARTYMELEAAQLMSFPATATGAYLDALALQFTGLERTTDETDASFRVRVLDAMAAPPGAGTVRDFRTWVSAVAGTGPIEVVNEGAGAVTVYVIADDHTVADGTLLGLVQNALDTHQPVSCTATATAADIFIDGDFTLLLRSVTSAQAFAYQEAVQSYFDGLAPGDDFNIYALLAAVGIPTSNYVSHNLDGYTTATVAVASGYFIHVDVIGVGV